MNGLDVCTLPREKIKENTTIIKDFALSGEIIISSFSLLLKIHNINVVVKNGRDICKLLLIGNSFKCGPNVFFVQFGDQKIYPPTFQKYKRLASRIILFVEFWATRTLL